MITCQTAPEEVSDLLQSFLSWQVSSEHLFFNEFNFYVMQAFRKFDEIAGKLTEQLRKVTKQVTDWHFAFQEFTAFVTLTSNVTP